MITLPIDLVDGRGKKYRVQYARPSGGKAGTGHNKTSTVQVVYDQSFVIKHVRYIMHDHQSKSDAVRKAIEYCIGPREAKSKFPSMYQPAI